MKRKIPYSREEQYENPYLGFGKNNPDNSKIIEYAKFKNNQKQTKLNIKFDFKKALKNIKPLTKMADMNYEQIKQAAFIDELNKIASGVPGPFIVAKHSNGPIPKGNFGKIEGRLSPKPSHVTEELSGECCDK